MTRFDIGHLNVDYLFRRLYEFLISVFWGEWHLPGLSSDAANTLRLIFWSLAIALLVAIIYYGTKLFQLREEEQRALVTLATEEPEVKQGRNLRWDKIKDYLASENPSDWKLAIIEADQMLDEMTRAMAYPGENLGERLKAVEVSDFTSLESAWEAHKVRNQIAHEASFQLTKREAVRVIGLFEEVFREFDFV